MGYLRDATEADALSLASRLRPADLAEIKATVGDTLSPAAVLVTSVKVSKVANAIVKNDGEVVALFGANQVLDDVGAVWMLASPGLEDREIVREFVRKSRAACDWMNERFPMLFNYVDARNTVHIRWLQWCGFTFLNRHEKHGPEGRPFYEFVRLQKCA